MQTSPVDFLSPRLPTTELLAGQRMSVSKGALMRWTLRTPARIEGSLEVQRGQNGSLPGEVLECCKRNSVGAPDVKSHPFLFILLSILAIGACHYAFMQTTKRYSDATIDL